MFQAYHHDLCEEAVHAVAVSSEMINPAHLSTRPFRPNRAMSAFYPLRAVPASTFSPHSGHTPLMLSVRLYPQVRHRPRLRPRARRPVRPHRHLARPDVGHRQPLHRRRSDPDRSRGTRHGGNDAPCGHRTDHPAKALVDPRPSTRGCRQAPRRAQRRDLQSAVRNLQSTICNTSTLRWQR